jgi:hypothetical protein
MGKARGNPDAIREQPLILVALQAGHELVSFLIYRRNKVQLSHRPRVNNRHLFGRIQICAGLQRIETGLVRG